MKWLRLALEIGLMRVQTFRVQKRSAAAVQYREPQRRPPLSPLPEPTGVNSELVFQRKQSAPARQPHITFSAPTFYTFSEHRFKL